MVIESISPEWSVSSKTLSQPEVKIHPEFQKWFDPLEEKEFEILEASIIKAGQADMPLVLWNGYLLDGHHRFKICQKHGLPYKVIHKVFEDEEYAEEYALEAQDGRRNITKFKYTEKEIRRNDLKLRNEAKERQKSNLKQFQTTDNQCSTVAQNSARRDEDRSDRTNYTLAEKAGVSHDTIHKTRYVMEKADKELLEQMRSGETSLHAGYVRTKQKETGLDSLFKRDDYRVVYCDFYEPHSMLGWNPIKQYEALKSLPVKDHIEDYATCFLWSALPEVDSTLRVMKAWGFSYETMFVLENDRKPEGHYNRCDHLVVIVGSSKFTCPPDTRDRLSSVIDSSVAGKQRIEKFRETIDAMYKTEEGPKLQIFNNNNSPDWDVINF